MTNPDLEIPGELLANEERDAGDLGKPNRVSFVHVDDFIDSNFGGDEGRRYARFFFTLHRLPAAQQADFRNWITPFELYCTLEGERFRVTGCSRMGDVWLAKNFAKDHGYDQRVNVAECSAWGAKP